MFYRHREIVGIPNTISFFIKIPFEKKPNTKYQKTVRPPLKKLGVKTDTNLSRQYHINDLSIKLNRANTLLFKIRKNVSLKILRSIILLFLTPTYPNALFSRFRIVALLHIVILQKKADTISIQFPYSNKVQS